MVDDDAAGPRVAPGPIKGSGRRAPWIVLGVILIAAAAIVVSLLIAVLVFRS